MRYHLGKFAAFSGCRAKKGAITFGVGTGSSALVLTAVF
jgi:hypothetical protein